MYLNNFKYYYRNENFCKKKSIPLVYKMTTGILKKKKLDTPLKDFINDLKNNSKVVNATNMAVIKSTLSTLKTLPNLLDYAIVSGVTAYLMYNYIHNYECNM